MKDVINKLWNFAFHTEKGLYLVFGVLTTLVSLSVRLPVLWTTDKEVLSTILGNIAGIIFAYFTNRTYVFNSKAEGTAKKKEAVMFFISRGITIGLDLLVMFVLVDCLVWNKTLSSILSTGIVIVLNYILSKIVVFKK